MHPHARIAIGSRSRGTGTAGTGGTFNAYGTMVGRDPEGFPTELEARRDAEQLRQEIAKAPIVGEVDEWAREHDGRR